MGFFQKLFNKKQEEKDPGYYQVKAFRGYFETMVFNEFWYTREAAETRKEEAKDSGLCVIMKKLIPGDPMEETVLFDNSYRFKPEPKPKPEEKEESEYEKFIRKKAGRNYVDYLLEELGVPEERWNPKLENDKWPAGTKPENYQRQVVEDISK